MISIILETMIFYNNKVIQQYINEDERYDYL